MLCVWVPVHACLSLCVRVCVASIKLWLISLCNHILISNWDGNGPWKSPSGNNARQQWACNWSALRETVMNNPSYIGREVCGGGCWEGMTRMHKVIYTSLTREIHHCTHSLCSCFFFRSVPDKYCVTVIVFVYLGKKKQKKNNIGQLFSINYKVVHLKTWIMIIHFIICKTYSLSGTK